MEIETDVYIFWPVMNLCRNEKKIGRYVGGSRGIETVDFLSLCLDVSMYHLGTCLHNYRG